MHYMERLYPKRSQMLYLYNIPSTRQNFKHNWYNSLIFLLPIINACIEKRCLFCLRLSCEIPFKESCRREFSEFVFCQWRLLYYIFTSVLYKNCGEYILMICYMCVSKSLYEDKLYPVFLTYLRPWVIWLMEQTQIIQQTGKYCREVQNSFYNSGQ